MWSRRGATVRLLAVGFLLACGGDSSGPPRIATVTITPGTADVTFGTTVQLTANPKDASGNPVPATTTTWASANNTIASVNGTGLVAGNQLGSTQITATINGVVGTASVNVKPPPVASVTITPAAPSTTVGATVQLTATALSNAGAVLSGRAVTWSSANPNIATVGVTTGAVGGVSVGSTQITANIEGVTASVTVTVGPSGPPLAITSISPNPLTPGGTVTIQGTGFGIDNSVTVGGVAAAITAATPTSLTVTIPASICLPTGNAAVRVTVSGAGSTQADHPFQSSTAPLVVAVGQQTTINNPANFCLQFPASATSEVYVIGVQSVSEVASERTPAVVRGAIPAGATGSTNTTAASPASQQGPAQIGSGLTLQARERRMRHRQAELQLRLQERQIPLLSAASAVEQSSPAASQVPGTTQRGDTVTIKVPNRSANLCLNSTSIRAVVRHVGQRAFFVEDTGNPAGGFTEADYQTLGTLFDSSVWDTDTNYFGLPSDRDNNTRIVIVVTKEVNRSGNILGFVTSGDFQPACPASNNGEYYYGFAPDPTGVYTLGDVTAEEARADWPVLLAHEFTHIIQLSRRNAAGTQTQSVWELEGQATLAEEVVGHAASGNRTGQNYNAGVVINRDATGSPLTTYSWYIDAVVDLLLYFGWDGTQAAGKVAGAPEECSWFLTSGDMGPCIGGRGAYGVSWSFLRWLSDQFGPTFPGGESGLHRALIGSTDVGFANISNRIGQPIDRLLAQWSAMLYVDDRIAGLDPTLTLSSWNMLSINGLIIQGNPQNPLGLRPYPRTFNNFADAITVRAGSSAYFRLSGSNRPATAISVSNSSGTLPGTMRVWVVRLQ